MGLPVSFAAANLDPEVLVPSALFDSVADNLLHNALLKRQSESELRVHVALADDASLLSVCDSGSAIRDDVLADLLHAPLASESGLGIGLYHAARQAESCGHELRLACNEPGKVCFELHRSGQATAARE